MVPTRWAWEERHPWLRLLLAFCLAFGTLLVVEVWSGEPVGRSLVIESSTLGAWMTYLFFVFPWPFKRRKN